MLPYDLGSYTDGISIRIPISISVICSQEHPLDERKDTKTNRELSKQSEGRAAGRDSVNGSESCAQSPAYIR